MAIFGFKTNRDKIIETMKENEFTFWKVKFNDSLQCISADEFKSLCLEWFDDNKPVSKLKMFVESSKSVQSILQSCDNKLQKYEEEYEYCQEQFLIFRNSFSKIEDMKLFDYRLEEFVDSVIRLENLRKKVQDTNLKIRNFNIEQGTNKLITTKFDLPNEYDDQIENELGFVSKYIDFITQINDLIEKNTLKPVIGNEEVIERLILMFEQSTPSSFTISDYEFWTSNHMIINEQKQAALFYEDIVADLRFKISNLKLKFSVNPTLETLIKFQISSIEDELDELCSKYIDRSTDFDSIKFGLNQLEKKVIANIEQYNKLISVLNNTLKLVEIEKPDEIKDITDYFLYSVSKHIERRQNLYGTSKDISIIEVNKLISKIENELYKLTEDQKNAILEAVDLLNQPYTASCLIQGDVSSGKTIVTIALMFLMALKGKKGIYIIPRRILRSQHKKTLLKYNELFETDLNIYDIEDEFDPDEADIILSGYSMSDHKLKSIDIEIGVIDEIQMLGVSQRNLVQTMFPNIDMFYTTATPHPRSKLITLIGNMDIIEIRQMPPGRKLKETHLFDQVDDKIIDKIRSEATKGYTTLIVCPLVNKAGTNDFENVRIAHETYSGLLPDLNVALLTNNLSETKKEELILGTINGEINVLVTTKLIEVGVDITSASTIIIHYPYTNKIKWGVSQLHQLRGRVGRANQEAFCYIERGGDVKEGSPIDSVYKTQDVFELTKNDFNWRGFESIIGTRQSGSTSKSKVDLEKRIKAYEAIAKNTQKLIGNLDDEFVSELQKEISKNRVENIN